MYQQLLSPWERVPGGGEHPIEDPGSSAQNGLLASGQIVGKPDARGEGVPVVIHQGLRNSVLSGYAYSIHVEPHVRQRNAGNGGESGTVLVQSAARQEGRRLRWVVEVRIEIRRRTLGIVSMGNAFPAEAQVDRQAVAHPPVVRGVEIVVVRGDVHEIHAGWFAVPRGEAEQEVRKPVASGRSVEIELPAGVELELLPLMGVRIGPTKLQVVPAVTPGEVVLPRVAAPSVIPRPPPRGVTDIVRRSDADPG